MDRRLARWLKTALVVSVIGPTAAQASNIKFYYDAAGRYIGQTTAASTDSGSQVNSYTYDKADNRQTKKLQVPHIQTSNQGLDVNQSLQEGQSVFSPDLKSQVVLQEDGNLVLYGPSGAVWSTGSQLAGARAGPGAVLVMQGDGNLVLYDPQWKALYSSGTNTPNSYLIVTNDVHVKIFAQGGVQKWSCPGGATC